MTFFGVFGVVFFFFFRTSVPQEPGQSPTSRDALLPLGYPIAQADEMFCSLQPIDSINMILYACTFPLLVKLPVFSQCMYRLLTATLENSLLLSLLTLWLEAKPLIK